MTRHPHSASHARRESRDRDDRVELVDRLVHEHAATGHRPRRTPRTGVEVALRAEPVRRVEVDARKAARLLPQPHVSRRNPCGTGTGSRPAACAGLRARVVRVRIPRRQWARSASRNRRASRVERVACDLAVGSGRRRHDDCVDGPAGEHRTQIGEGGDVEIGPGFLRARLVDVADGGRAGALGLAQ